MIGSMYAVFFAEFQETNGYGQTGARFMILPRPLVEPSAGF